MTPNFVTLTDKLYRCKMRQQRVLAYVKLMANLSGTDMLTIEIPPVFPSKLA
jgi:hypothetical protein